MASDPNEQKGLQLVAEAEKKLKGSSGFLQTLFGRGTQKLEDACDLYGRAANSFKMAKNWAAAGNAFCQCSELQLKMDSRHDAATSYVDAANCYRKTDPRVAVSCLEKAIEIYTDMGRFTIAAKHHMTIAEIYESDVVDIEQAIRNYERSADYYRGEESNSLANKCLLRVAQLVVQVEPPQYVKAVDIFEQLATSAMDNSLLKYSAKEYFFKAALCRMCTDHLDASIALPKYEEMYPAFADSREYKLLKKLCQALEECDVDAYTEAVADYDSISRLDPWLTSVMLKIKKTIMKDEDEEGLK